MTPNIDPSRLSREELDQLMRELQAEQSRRNDQQDLSGSTEARGQMKKATRQRCITDLSREEFERELEIDPGEFQVIKTYPLGPDGPCFLQIVPRKPEQPEVVR